MKIMLPILVSVLALVAVVCSQNDDSKFTIRAENTDNMTKDDCKELFRSSEARDKTQTWMELFCTYFTYGFDKETSIQYADKSMKDGDKDGNGVIDGKEIYGGEN